MEVQQQQQGEMLSKKKRKGKGRKKKGKFPVYVLMKNEHPIPAGKETPTFIRGVREKKRFLPP